MIKIDLGSIEVDEDTARGIMRIGKSFGFGVKPAVVLLLRVFAPIADLGRYLHYKGGIYRKLLRSKSETESTPITTYQNEATCEVWSRLTEEFDAHVQIEEGSHPLPRFRRM